MEMLLCVDEEEDEGACVYVYAGRGVDFDRSTFGGGSSNAGAGNDMAGRGVESERRPGRTSVGEPEDVLRALLAAFWVLVVGESESESAVGEGEGDDDDAAGRLRGMSEELVLLKSPDVVLLLLPCCI